MTKDTNKAQLSSTNPMAAEQIERAYKDFVDACAMKRHIYRHGGFSDTRTGSAITFGTLALFLIALHFLNRYPNEAAAAMLLSGIFGATCGWWFGRKWRQTVERVQDKYAAAKLFLVTAEDVRAIGPMLDIFSHQTATDEIAPAFLHLLPRMTREDACLLTHSQRQCLHRLLREPYSSNLALELAIVGAMEHIGDSSTPAVLARLSRSRDTPPQLAQAAQHCLDALNARNVQENQTQTLLRAAPMPAAHRAQLLRPVLAHTEPDAPEQLLRAYGDGDMR